MISPVSSLASSSVPLDLARAAQNGGATGRPSPADLQKAAKQFEAIMVRQLLKPAIEPMMNGGGALGAAGGGGGGGQGGGGGIYGYLLTDTLANSMTQGGGLGLASVISRQLAPTVSAAAEAADPE